MQELSGRPHSIGDLILQCRGLPADEPLPEVRKHVAAPQKLLRPRLAQNDSRVDLLLDPQGDSPWQVRLDDAGDGSGVRPLRGEDKVDSRRARLRPQPLDRGLERTTQRFVGEEVLVLVDHDDVARELLAGRGGAVVLVDVVELA